MKTIEKITNLNSFISIMNKMLHSSGTQHSTSQLWFRGQSNADWDLIPSIYRHKEYGYFEREMIRDFKLLSYEMLEKQPTNELEWLFLMQHYGLDTRLLDWSESYLIALYFAVWNYADTCDCAVWILKPWSLNLVSIQQQTIPISSYPDLDKYTLDSSQTKIVREVEGLLPIALRPVKNSARIVAQKGVFTIHGKKTDPLNRIVEEHNLNSGDKILLESLIIDGKCKLKILKELYYAGISYSIIFPEIQGICNDIKIRYSTDFIQQNCQ
ncbi:MAG: FRG domain-containing protein [Prevotellaceae bacterium]|jgi:hypothetical protein|nr:FRG domain-containing protein [Prevotellaceae bacterium]